MKKHLFFVLLAVVLHACSAPNLRGDKSDILNIGTIFNRYTEYRDIAYSDFNRQKLDIYVADQPAEGKPLVVFFYGGSWQQGDKEIYSFLAKTFTDNGYSVVIPNYRLYPKVLYPDFLYDCAEAVAWIEKHASEYNISTDNLFLMGHSAGGYNASMLAVDRNYLYMAGLDNYDIRGVIALAAPLDFLPIKGKKLKKIFSKGPPEKTQPINYVGPNTTTPFLLLSGEDDDVVAKENSIHMAKKLEKYNVPVSTKFYEGVGHLGIIRGLSWFTGIQESMMKEINAFIKDNTESPASSS